MRLLIPRWHQRLRFLQHLKAKLQTFEPDLRPAGHDALSALNLCHEIMQPYPGVQQDWPRGFVFGASPVHRLFTSFPNSQFDI
jgi:hypothetical protein